MNRPKMSTVLICIGLFLFFLFLGFPFSNLKGYVFNKIYSQTQILLVAEEIYPSLLGWPGVGAKNVSVSFPLSSNRELEVSCKKLTVRVGLGSLFPPTASISLYLKSLKEGGNLYVKYRNSKARTKIVLDASDIALRQIQPPWNTEPFTGFVNFDVVLNLETAAYSESTGEIELSVDNLKIPIQNFHEMGIVIPEIKVGTMKSKIAVKNGMADLSNIQIGNKDSDLQGTLNGELKLGTDLMSSYLNLILRFKLSETYAALPEVKNLVVLLYSSFRSSKGDYAMKWSNRLHDMAYDPSKAFPQSLRD